MLSLAAIYRRLRATIGRVPVVRRAFGRSSMSQSQASTIFVNGADPQLPVAGTHQGRHFCFPVYDNYRWSVKRGWTTYRSLVGLSALAHANVLAQHELDFFRSSVGPRTLERSLDEIDAFAMPILDRNQDLFVPGARIHLPRSVLHHIDERVELSRRHHLFGFDLARRLGLEVPKPRGRVLEIGFNEGYSPISLARLGFEVHAIDNSYGLDTSAPGEIAFVAKHANAAINTAYADITKRTPYPDAYFDYVFSASVLEHVIEIDDALREIKRILRPGGLAIHSFGSYHCCDGAHAIAIPDQPWGHSRMTAHEYEDYIRQWRPYEAEASIAWLRTALARRPIASTAVALAKAGFRLSYWAETPSPENHLRHLTPEIVNQALSVNPDISIDDLITRDVYFIATH